MLMQNQRQVSPQRGLPVDVMTGASSAITISGETVQLYYSNSGTLTADAGQAAGTAVIGLLTYDQILSKIGSALATFGDSSLSFTSTALTTETGIVSYINFEEYDAMKWSARLAAIGALLSNGEYVVDYRLGIIYGKKASVTTTLTGTTYQVAVSTSSIVPGTGPANLGKAEDSAHASGDVGVEVLEVRRDTCVSSAGTDGDYATKNQDAEGYSYTRDKAYDTASAAEKASLIRDISDQYVNETLIDTTNVAAATNYYPSSAGLAMDGYKNLSIQGLTSGGVTTTIEVTLDDAASPDWIDITDTCYDWTSASASRYRSSWVDLNFLFFLQDMNVRAVRIKSVTADNTNAVQYNIRRIY